MSSSAPHATDDSGHARPAQRETLVESIQALLVAFVLAMAFRSFVLEGFVIPTGSMAPTLMGQHIRYQSPLSGYEFAFDIAPVLEGIRQHGGDPRTLRPVGLRDPMVWTPRPSIGEPPLELATRSRSGDRVLVAKALYPFSAPRRYDVVVFKNPTDPFGEAQNYIKRLVGLPSERILMADGDVFAGPLAEPTNRDALSDLRIQRKPVHVQRAVWQAVHSMDWPLVDVARFEAATRERWRGVPWTSTGWDIDDMRTLRRGSAEPTTLEWDSAIHPIDDWTSYNVLRDSIRFPISDLRISAALSAERPGALRSRLELRARRHVFLFELADGAATLSMWPEEEPERQVSVSRPFRTPAPGRSVEVEFWHVDQRMSIHLGQREIVALEYDWDPGLRLLHALNGRTLAQYAANPVQQQPTPPQLRWTLEGSPLELRRLRLDRDLYYHPTTLNPRSEQVPQNGPSIHGLGFGTDPAAPGRIPADHFLMLGDNSAASRDGRVWGRAHPLVAMRFGEQEPFLVHRRLLLGKAWAVYFPAPMPVGDKGRTALPDFGRLRFIR